MTTQVLTAAPALVRRPVPWRRLIWVAWRRYRTTLAAVAALLAVLATYLLIRGSQMRSAYAAAEACSPKTAANCRYAFVTFHNTYGNGGLTAALLLYLPAVIGAFAGAPLLAREMETGTFRYAWTQGVGRTRWALALLVPGALGVAITSAALGGLVTWYQQPLLATAIDERLHASTFPVTGVAVIGWGLAAFAIGVLVGLLAGRVLPALAATLAGWTGLAFLAANPLRPHYQTPSVTSSLQLGARDMAIQQWWTHGGIRVTDSQINVVLQAIGVQTGGGGNFQAGPGSSNVDPVQYLLQHGYTQWTSYQPDSRYWPFQWMEFGWLTILSVILLAAALWLVRRRAA